MEIRSFRADYRDLPRHWYGGDPWKTHLYNALNLLFPAGEQFLIRSMGRFREQITDPTLQEEIRTFIGQEAQHGRAHRQPIAMLEAQGLAVRDWLAGYEHALTRVERWMPARLCLAATVGAEHLTASFAQHALENRFLDEAHPTMRDLLLWHAAEEVEHRAVAFDVHRAVGGGYLMRVLGLLIAVAAVVFFWWSATRHLLKQEPDQDTIRQRRADLKEKGRTPGGLIRRCLLPYFRRDFHPAQEWDDSLSVAHFQQNEIHAAL